jgi:hypothetical protein
MDLVNLDTQSGIAGAYADSPGYVHSVPRLSLKIRLYLSALLGVPFYRYGEIGNLAYTIGKNILDGVILYAMFSMAETELKVAAVLGIAAKYAYPGITIVSSTFVSGFIDRLEAVNKTGRQIPALIRALVGIGAGQSAGAIFLLLCFPPFYKYLFYGVPFRTYLIVALYLLYQICDGSSQIVEGRTWFKIIEIKIRKGDNRLLSRHFWVIYAVSLNVQLLLGQIFLWSSLAIAAAFSPNLASPAVLLTICVGFASVVLSKFILPIAYRFRLCC